MNPPENLHQEYNRLRAWQGMTRTKVARALNRGDYKSAGHLTGMLSDSEHAMTELRLALIRNGVMRPVNNAVNNTNNL